MRHILTDEKSGLPRTAVTAARKRLGLSYNALEQRFLHDGPPGMPRFNHALAVFDYCAGLDAGGYQGGVVGWTAEQIRAVRTQVEDKGLFFEGQVAMPTDRTDVARFARELHTLSEAGGRIVRVVSHGGRRYEVFDSLPAYTAWKTQAWRSLRLAEPAARRAGIKLAIENHKDLRDEELLDHVRRISSPFVGVCLDTGNSLALLHDPMTTVAALAPYAISCHLKDMAVAPCPEGFLLAEVPLGDGMLDLPRMMAHLRASNPSIEFSLEMITRDPLLIPCLSERYFATMPGLPAAALAATMALVKKHAAKLPLPTTAQLNPAGKVAAEDANNRRSLAFARASLGL